MKKVVAVLLSLFLLLMLVPGSTTGLNSSVYESLCPFSIQSGDVDGDGDTDFDDLYALSASFGTEVGELNYDPNVDLDADGDIDVYDLHEIGIYFGTYDVTVHVQNQYGEPLGAGEAKVEIWCAGSPLPGWKKIDSEGNAYFCLSPSTPLSEYKAHVLVGAKQYWSESFGVPDETYIIIEVTV